MVEFRPLEAFEYSRAAGDFASLIAPPYDVIDPRARARLAAASPYNIVHLSLPEPDGALDRYSAAAKTLSRWIAENVLEVSRPAFYVIEQTFEIAAQKLVRTGVFGQVRLVPWRQGIFPHEVTLPKPKEDRLKLYRATRIVPGPTFSLFADESGDVRSELDRIKRGVPYRTADGPEGSFDRIWKLTDAGLIARIAEAFAPENFFVADGHHRYETALAFRDELARNAPLPDDHPANFALTCAVPFDDPGLVILPTHRLLSLDPAVSAADALAALRVDYDLDPVDSLAAYDGLGQPVPSPFALYTRGGALLARIKQDARERFSQAAGRVMSSVNTYEVLKMVLPRFFNNVQEAIDHERISYTHSAADAVALVDSSGCQAAVILAPLTVRAMADVVAAGNLMPPKSTYFYPKLPTGAVIKPLESPLK